MFKKNLSEAYRMLSDTEALLCRIMEFGADYNEQFYKLQKEIFRKNKEAAL